MKKILMIIISIVCFSCNESDIPKIIIPITETNYSFNKFNKIEEFTYDSCEYIILCRNGNSQTISHKGNCKNKIHKYGS